MCSKQKNLLSNNTVLPTLPFTLLCIPVFKCTFTFSFSQPLPHLPLDLSLSLSPPISLLLPHSSLSLSLPLSLPHFSPPLSLSPMLARMSSPPLTLSSSLIQWGQLTGAVSDRRHSLARSLTWGGEGGREREGGREGEGEREWEREKLRRKERRKWVGRETKGRKEEEGERGRKEEEGERGRKIRLCTQDMYMYIHCII